MIKTVCNLCKYETTITLGKCHCGGIVQEVITEKIDDDEIAVKTSKIDEIIAEIKMNTITLTMKAKSAVVLK